MSSHDFGSLHVVDIILGEFCTLNDLCRTAVAGRCLRSLMQGCQGSTYEAWPQVASSGLKLLRPVHIATARAMKQSQRKQSTLICAPLTFDLFVMWTSLTTLGPKRSTYSCVGFKLASSLSQVALAHVVQTDLMLAMEAVMEAILDASVISSSTPTSLYLSTCIVTS